MKKIAHNLHPWEWITLIGVICGAGVSVTVFAFATFEAAGSAEKVEKKLGSNITRVEMKVDALLLHQGLNPKAYEVEK